MKKILALLLAVVMAAAICVGCGNTTKSDSSSQTSNKASTDDWSYIKDKGDLVIGITYFEPMNYKAKDGTLTGFETEFAQKVCAKLGVKATFQKIDWDSKEVELNSKTIDCIWNGLTITEDRQKNMEISTPYMENKQVVVTKASNASTYTTADSLKGKTVVAEKKSAGEDVAKSDNFFKQADYVSVDSQAKALLEVKSGTADAAIIDYVMSIGTITNGSDYSDLKVVEGKEFAKEQYGVALRKNSTATLEKLNAAMQAVANDGDLTKIAKKYDLQDLLLLK